MYYRLSVLPRKIKIAFMLLCDAVLLPLALYSAIALRFGTFQIDVSSFNWIFLALPIITIPIFIRVGLYRAVIRYMDDKIIATVLYGVSLSVLILMALVVMAHVEGVPRSSIIIYWVMAIAYIASSRFMARGVLRSLESNGDRRQAVGIYGAGRAGLQTALALMSGPEFKPVAFFDDNPELQGTSVAGIRVYDSKDAFNVMDAKNCSQLLLAMPSASRSRKREIIQFFEGKNITLKTLPGIGDLVDGRVRIEDIREVGVEDLLGRDPVPPFENLLNKCILGKSVLITGAGGSIGSELCRQIVKLAPKKIVILEQSEYALYKLEQELCREFDSSKIMPILGSVLDKAAVSELIAQHKVETIYHAAAYKHVPLVESNIATGVMNNAFGTLCVAEAAAENGVETFVLISTDKAVRPTNVMGASKRFAEMILQAMQAEGSIKTRFCMVRFGNVLGSSGSVVPLFKEQIRKGGPVTVTHPEVTRFFMTIPEAAQLVLQAGSMGTGGDVFVLDMGEPVKIVDLAKKVIELSGFTVRDASGVGDVAIEFVGMRPGEKLYEELLIGDSVSPTEHPRIMRAEESFIELPKLKGKMTEIRELCASGRSMDVKSKLQQLIPEFKSVD